MTWREWELSPDWISEDTCPECGHSLIITDRISAFTNNDVYNGICNTCRRQYTVTMHESTVTVNVLAANQQDRIDELEARVARLEAMVQKLTERKPVSLPDTPKPTTEEADFRKKYGYLF